jgi:hypothetical protein
MRKLISWILLIAALAGAFYQWRTKKAQLRATARILQARLFPCSFPVTYSIGTIDPGYTISKQELGDALIEAETAWENPAHKNLFEFTRSSGDVTITLVYDNRQASLDKLKALGITTDQSLDSYKSLKAKYDELAAKVDAEDSRLKGIMGRYKERETAYNAEVRRMNQRGSASRAEVRRVDSTRGALAMQFGGIKMIETAVNSDVDTLNALGTTLNQLIVQLNINVDQYNRAGATIGRYEEGLYIISGGIQTIEIYKYTNHAQLVSLLAHELGHALGLEHVADPESLMYPVNRGRGLNLTGKDLAELVRVCR